MTTSALPNAGIWRTPPRIAAWNRLTAGESVVTHRRRYGARDGVDSMVDLLLLDRANPRSVAFQLARVRARVRRGGHDIPEADIRRRFETSRVNLVELMPVLAALRVYDNSAETDPARGRPPAPRLVLHVDRGRIVAPVDLAATPQWAKAIVARAIRK